MHDSLIIYHNPNDVDPQSIQKVVIWLHGLGATADDFVPVVPQLGLTDAVKFIFPQAPNLAVTVNGGYVMPAWYDILHMDDLQRTVDIAGIEASCARIMQIIQSEIQRGVRPNDIVLSGFSQGGAVVYHTALWYQQTTQQTLGGLVALSTYWATKAQFAADDFTKTDMPILIAHGVYDPVVAPVFAHNAKAVLEDLGFAPTLQTYPIAHQVSTEEIAAIGRWLNSVLNS